MNTDNTTLKASLFQQCYQQVTGTFFVSTADNRSAQIMLKNGVIQGANYADHDSSEALNLLIELDDIRFSFTEGLSFPTRTQLLGSQAISFLEEQGYMRFLSKQAAVETTETQPEEAKVEEDDSKDVMFYRGQAIKKSTPRAETDLKPEKTTAARTVRIYRGQKVYA